jgi:hypothetical protein
MPAQKGLAVLEQHLAVSDVRLRGIRGFSAWPADISLDAPQKLLLDKSFREGFAALIVCKGTCSYQVLWNTFKRIAARLSANETALFSDAASKAYRLMV